MIGLRTVFAVSMSAVIGSTSACSLVLDFSKDVPRPDAAPDAFAENGQCEFGEPNEQPSAAMELSPSTVQAAICDPGDADYFRITTQTDAQRVRLDLAFVQAKGDLDLRLYAPDGITRLASSSGFGDSEQIVCPSMNCAQLAAGSYILVVFGATNQQRNLYTLSVAVE